MLKDFKTRSYLLFAALAVLILGAAGWYFAGKTREATADVLDVRDIPDTGDASRLTRVTRRPTPLASIPWKREPDTLAPAVLDTARLPWFREGDRPESVTLTCASLPWSRQTVFGAPESRSPAATAMDVAPAALPWDAQREASYAPVFLPTGELPWRY